MDRLGLRAWFGEFDEVLLRSGRENVGWLKEVFEQKSVSRCRDFEVEGEDATSVSISVAWQKLS